MTQEDKELLLKDLCARLPYGVIIQEYNEEYGYADNALNTIGIGYFSIHEACIEGTWINHIENVKPYLRPMSSMTEEEKEELKSKCIHTETEEDWEGVRCDVWGIQILDKYDTRRWDNPIYPSTINIDAIDWLNTRHFDYRGLIEKGLAIEVTKENNPYKK